jgi:hypothetical protein
MPRSKQIDLIFVFAMVAGLGVGHPDRARCEGTADAEAERIGQLLLTGVRDGRDRLRKGVVRARGDWVEQADASTRPIAFYAAFDMDEERLRFDYTRRARFRGHEGDEAQGRRWSSDITDYYIRRPDASVRFERIQERDGPGEITIWPADSQPPSGVTIYDVRAIGLLTREAIKRRYTLADVFEKVYAAHSPGEVVDEGGGLWRLSRDVTFPKGTYRFTLWVDREHGFSPTRLEERSRPAPADSRGPNKMPWTLQFVSTASWKEVNDVFVPVSWRIEEWLGKRLVRTYTYNLEWLSVNEPPSAELFTVDSLNSADGTLVTNAIGQHPFIERVIGDPDSVLKGTVFGTHGSYRRLSWTWTQALLVAVGVVLAVLLTAVVLARRRARNNASE